MWWQQRSKHECSYRYISLSFNYEKQLASEVFKTVAKTYTKNENWRDKIAQSKALKHQWYEQHHFEIKVFTLHSSFVDIKLKIKQIIYS